MVYGRPGHPGRPLPYLQPLDLVSSLPKIQLSLPAFAFGFNDKRNDMYESRKEKTDDDDDKEGNDMR